MLCLHLLQIAPGLRQHADDPAGAERAGVDDAADRGGLPGADAADLRPRQPLRPVRARPRQPDRLRDGGVKHSLQNAPRVKSRSPLAKPDQGARGRSRAMPKRQKVKSASSTAAAGAADVAADRHERAKDYLSPAEMGRLLDAAKAGRHGMRDHLLVLMTLPPRPARQRGRGPARATRSTSTGPGCGSAGSRAGSRSSSPSPATSCAPSSAISPPARTHCPGCSSPSAASR